MFAFSKLAWVLIQPSNLLLLLLVLAALSLLLGNRRIGTWLLCGVTVVLLAVTLLPVGAWLLLPIENRFPPPVLPVKNTRYTCGDFDLSGRRRMYINRGVGHLWRVRFNVRPEITLHELQQDLRGL